MSEDHTPREDMAAGRGFSLTSRQRLLIFILGSVVIAMIMVAVGLALYRSGGTAQLDLSRPGYQAVQSKVEKADRFKEFSGTGEIDEKSLQEFHDLYTTQAERVTSASVFDPSVLDTQTLGLDQTEAVAGQ